MNGTGPVVSMFKYSLLTLSLLLLMPVANGQTVTKATGAAQPVVTAEVPGFSQAELDQMLAPVALYPDTVLSHVLIAATYPLEIVKATRWLSAQQAMTSEQALKAAENEPWDPSVRALVAFPPLLTKMNNELEWTQKLGDAFLIQESQVMATVQSLREKAYSAGNLQQQEHITVQRQEKVIIIEPRQPEVVYVPVYDTRVVYGDWWWRDYPPIHWPYPAHYRSSSYVYWGAGARVSSGFYFSTFFWPQRQIVVINHHQRPNYYYRPRDIIRHEERRHWQHNPQHRHGVVYHRGYQPTREISGNPYRHRDATEQRRWAADQRQRNNVSVPEDRRIRAEYPIDLRRVQTGGPLERQAERTVERTRPDPDRERLHRQQFDRAATARQAQLDPTGVSRERQGGQGSIARPDQPGRGQTTPQQERPVFDRSRRVERHEPAEQPHQNERRERPVYETPRPIERQERPVYQTPKPIERQERPVYETRKPVERQERPVYETPRPIERQERPVFETPRPIERRERPVFETPPVVERQPRAESNAPRRIERQERPVYETPRPIE